MVLFGSFKIKTITLASTVIIAFAALACVGFADRALRGLHDRIDYQTTNTVPSLHGIAQIDGAVGDARLLIAKYFSARTPDELVAREQQFETQVTKVDGLLKAYAPLVSDERERRIYDTTVANWEDWKAGAARVSGLLMANRRDDALRVFNDDLSEIGAKMDKSIGEDVDYNVAIAKRLGAEASGASTQALTVLVALGGVVLAMSVLAGLVLRNRLTLPLDRLQHAMGEMAGGDLDRTIPGLQLADEVGEIGRALAAIKDGVGARTLADAEQRAAAQATVVDSLGSALGDLRAGKLDQTIDAVFPREYEGLRADFNETLASLAEVMVQVSGSGESVTTGSGEIAAAATDLSNRTETQAAAIEETSAAVRQLSKAVSTAAGVAQEAAQNALESEQETATSGELMIQAVSAMDQIAQSSRTMEEIVSLIDGIAFQTNLLALNAGVEAARAGEAGKGFAVVASEVRSLAQRASEAASEIGGIIKSSGRSVNEGVGLITRTQQALELIHARTRTMAEQIQSIAGSAREQAGAIGQVESAVTEMDGMTQRNAALVEEMTAAARSLSTEAQGLDRLMQRFDTGRPRTRLAPPQQITRAAPFVTGAGAAARLPRPAPPVAGNTALADDWSDF